MTKTFSFSAKVWLYPGAAAWHFASVDEKTTEEIDSYFKDFKHGFGSLPVSATVGKTTWKTSIFPDSKTNTYLLPLKKDVRQKEKINEGDKINIKLEIHD